MKSLTISELARGAGVPTSTVRFYERRGLLKADSRTAANYRNYTAQTSERLRFIRAAQASGFSLADIGQMLKLTRSGKSPCADVIALITHRLDEVRQRARELRRVERTLAAALKSCCRGGSDWCLRIQTLKA